MRRRWIWFTLSLLTAVGVGAAAIVSPDVRKVFVESADAVSGWSTELRDLAARLPETETDERSLDGASASMLIVFGEADAAAFALVSIGPNSPPSVIVLPQDLLLSVPGFGEYRLGEALVFEGPELVSLAVTNEFGIRIDRLVVLPPGSLAAAITTTVTVELAAPFFVDDGTSIERQLPAGESQVTADLLEVLLVEEGAGDPFEWIQRQGTAWRAILGAVEVEPRTADRLLASEGPDAADLLVTVAGAEDAVVATLPVEPADDGGSRTALTTVGDRIDGFVADRLGHLLIRPEGRPRIEILNGNGRVGSTRVVAEILIRNGYWLIRTDNADTFEYTDTLVIAQGSASEATAREIVDLLGHGLLFLEVQAPSGIIDVSIIVGTDVPTGEG